MHISDNSPKWQFTIQKEKLFLLLQICFAVKTLVQPNAVQLELNAVQLEPYSNHTSKRSTTPIFENNGAENI